MQLIRKLQIKSGQSGGALTSAWHKNHFPDMPFWCASSWVTVPAAWLSFQAVLPLLFSLASPSLSYISLNKPAATSTSPCENKPHIWRENCSLQIYSHSQKSSPLQKGFFNTQCAYAKMPHQIFLTSFLHWTNLPAGVYSCCSQGGNGINWAMEAIEVAIVLCFIHLS